MQLQVVRHWLVLPDMLDDPQRPHWQDQHYEGAEMEKDTGSQLIMDGEVMNSLTNGGFLGKEGRAATHDPCVASNHCTSVQMGFHFREAMHSFNLIPLGAKVTNPRLGLQPQIPGARRLSASKKLRPRSRTSYPKNHMLRTFEDRELQRFGCAHRAPCEPR